MTLDEIAGFFEFPVGYVESILASGRLQSSLYNEIRPTEALCLSSVFDVIEYGLSSGDLPVKVPAADAALLVLYLCEACELESWAEWSFEERASELMRSAVEDGLFTAYEDHAARVAMTIVTTQAALLNLCAQTDIKSQIRVPCSDEGRQIYREPRLS